MTGWSDLISELDRWPAGKATFWWRDDDATIRSERLARLLALPDLPLSIAVVPAHMRVSLAEQIDQPRIDVLQHGFAHTNYQTDESKKAELGDARPLAAIQEELARGWQRLSVLYRQARTARGGAALEPYRRQGDGRAFRGWAMSGFPSIARASPRMTG